ncbi:Gfo/Idh/MocA family oxidoreductase [Candidatus Uhrbacteria bacterium]|nr:Gfo/Idh/MocA family oxidoreductase [Candidatus Uhrbacteria bacterium]
MKKLKAAVIGLGVGEQHIAGYQSHPDCEVVALCDMDQEKRNMAKEKYPELKVVARADEILTDPEIDVVSIATYDDVHYAQVIQAIEHGKHVFVEKPLCLQESHARHIRSTLREHPRVRMSSNLILRKSPRFERVRDIHRQGKFGELFYVEADYNYGRLHKITEGWRGKLDFYSVVHGGGVHMVDLLLWMTGDEVEEVIAYGNAISVKGTQFRFNDMVVSILKFKSGLIGKVAVNFGCVYPHFNSLTLYGTRATFVNGLHEGLFYTARDPMVPPEAITAPYPGVLKGALIPGFIDTILGKGKPEVSEDDIFRVMSVCFAIEKAHTQGRCVKVEYI